MPSVKGISTLVRGQDIKADLDGVYRANGYTGDSYAGEDVASDLEHPHGQGAPENSLGWCPQFREPYQWRHEEQTVARNEPKLNECQGNWVAKLNEYGLSRV